MEGDTSQQLQSHNKLDISYFKVLANICLKVEIAFLILTAWTVLSDEEDFSPSSLVAGLLARVRPLLQQRHLVRHQGGG